MKFVVLGASGSVGRHVVEQGLGQGHQITAVTRNQATIKQQHPLLTVVEQDLFDVDRLTPVIAAQDAVIVTLGAGSRGGVRGAGTASVVAAMHRTGVRRLIVQSTLGAGDSRPTLNLTWRYLMFGLLLRNAYADHHEQEQVTRQSGLDWTITRPGAFMEGPRTGEYRRGFAPMRERKVPKISRADVADFLLEQLTETRWIGKAPAQAYPAGSDRPITASSASDAHSG